MNIKILGTGCASCKSMFNDVTRIVDRNYWIAEVKYVQDIVRIISYGVMATPVLVINEKVVMAGHHGLSKIEKVLRDTVDSWAA